MSFFDQILNMPIGDRKHNLQALIRHFLKLKPSLLDESDSLITINKMNSVNDTNNLKQIVQLRAGNSMHNDWPDFSLLSQQKQEKVLEDCVVSLFRKICDNGKKTVLIHHDTDPVNYRQILNFCGPNLLETLRRDGFNAWVVNPTDINESCLSLDKALLERMNFISLILTGPFGLTLDYNKDTKTFKFPFHVSGSPEKERSVLLNDFFYVPNHSTTDKVFNRYKLSVPLPRDQTRHRRKFTAIPVGSLKNCRIRGTRQGIKPENRDKILFCAEAYDYANSVAKKYGIILIRSILKRFQNSTLIYRSHPAWINDPITLNIRESFAGEQRFIFDTHITSEEIMATGCALITDGSVSGLTYCLATSRPAIYFNPLSLYARFDSNVTGFNFENGKLFRFTSSIDQTLNALEDLVADPAKEFDEITELTEKVYSHPDNGMEYLLSSIHAIVENIPLPDWKSFEVSENEVGNESASDYSGLIKNNLLHISQFSPLLKKDLSILDTEYAVSERMINYVSFTCPGTHLLIIKNNLNALFSGIEKYGCSSTSIKLIDPLFVQLIARGNRDEVGDAIKMLQKANRTLLRDAPKSIDGSCLLQLFRSTYAGTILGKIADISKQTDLELNEIRSLIAEFSLASRVPTGVIKTLTIQNNEVCDLSFTCKNCGLDHSINLQFWYSYNELCESCGEVNHIDPFEKALHLPETFFAQLPPEGKIVLWGAGGFYYKLMQKYDWLSSDRFLLVDAKKSEQGLRICQKTVHSPDIIVHNNIKMVIITAVSRKDEICATLRDNYPSIEYIFVPALDITSYGIVPFLKRL
jgi:hypothetical protein